MRAKTREEEPKRHPVRKFECSACKVSDHRMSTLKVGENVRRGCISCGGDASVVGDEAPGWMDEQIGLVSRHFDVVDFVVREGRAEFEVNTEDRKRSFRELFAEAGRRKYVPVMREDRGGLKIVMLKRPDVKPSNVLINIALFSLTFLTTFLAGYYLLFGTVPQAALFSCAIMLMLGTHEAGHKIAAWKNGVQSTMPYFIPAPNFLGTFGAVINMKSPIPTRDALVEIGSAGPLAGFAIAVPLTIVGLALSKPDPTGFFFPFTPAIFGLMQIGMFGRIPAGMALNPIAFAGWVALLLTMFNLLPAGQLDGGHVSRGLMKRDSHYTLTRSLGFTLAISGIFLPELPLWLWGFLILLMFRKPHTGALDDVSPLSSGHKRLAMLSFAVFLLCMPIPAF